MKKIIAALLLITTTCISVSYAANIDPRTQQGVGLVLSGGGAKGLYHVGVIKALEENEVPIDYISGSSMGAVVAALYAAGWSPERMWEFFATDTVSMWLSGRIPVQYNNYYAQFRPTPEMVGVNIIKNQEKNKNSVQLPSNLISPYMLDIAFTQLMAPASYAARGVFDSLFVPFRCTATDIYKGELVTFKEGELPLAVRASMTIPFVFSAIEVDSAQLFDSGVMNNFPVQVLQEDFNPKHIIGSTCADNYKEPDPHNITNQVMTLATRHTDYNVPNPETDILIRHILQNYTVLDYNKGQEIMTIGYQDALKQIPEIKKKIKLTRTKTQVEKNRQNFRRKIPELTFDSVIISGLTPAQTKYVQRQLRTTKIKYFTYEYFYEQYMKLIKAGIFTAGFPEMSYNEETGYYRIHLDMQTKSSMRFSLGGNISSTSLNQGHLSFTYKQATTVASTYRIEGDFGMHYNALQLSGNHHIHTNRPYYLDYKAYIKSTNFSGGNMDNYYKDVNWRYLNKQEIALEVSAAIPIFKTSAFRVKAAINNSQYKYFENIFTNKDTASFSVFNHITLNPLIETNSLNYAMYGNLGTKQKFSLKYTGGLETFRPGSVAGHIAAKNIQKWWIEAKYVREQYSQLNQWLTLGYLVDVTLSNHPGFVNQMSTSITAPHFAPTPQTNTMFIREFSAASYAAAGVIPVFNILKNRQLYLKTYLYAFVPDTIFGMSDPGQWQQYLRFIYGGTIVYQTPIGPASFNVTKYTTGPNGWNLQFNFGYLLFKNA